jgi:hypothetical protein
MAAQAPYVLSLAATGTPAAFFTLKTTTISIPTLLCFGLMCLFFFRGGGGGGGGGGGV